MSDTNTVIDAIPYAARLGAQVETLDGDSARVVLPYKDENSNPGQALHGGVAASMINLGGLLVGQQTLGDEAAPLHTCSIEVNYLAAAVGEPIVAESTMLRRGKELCFVETSVKTEEGKRIAEGLSTIRGRFGAEESPNIAVAGDHGESDPGMMGPFLAQRVEFIGRLGLSVEHMAGGTSRIAMPFIDINANESGGVHEGPVLALLDTTGAMAAWAETGPGAFKASTVGVHAYMIAPAATEDLVAYGTMRQRDNEIFWCDVEVATQAGARLVARGTVVYRIVIPESA